jgi:hypothetical protein
LNVTLHTLTHRINIALPTITSPDLSALENVTVPDTISQALSTLNSSLPTLAQLREQIDNLIDVPFSALRTDINSSLTGKSVDLSLFPVPAQNSVSFCGNLDVGGVDDVANVILTFLKIAMGLTALAMVILLLGTAWWERRCQRKLVEHVEMVRGQWREVPSLSTTTSPNGGEFVPTVDSLLTFLSGTQHPSLYAFFQRLKLSPAMRCDLEWLSSLIFHPRPLAFLAIGITTLLAVEAQFLALGIVRGKAADQAEKSLGALADDVGNQINSVLLAQGTEWANGVNGVIMDFQNGVNNDMVCGFAGFSAFSPFFSNDC